MYVGYKQKVECFNTLPDTDNVKIHEVSESLCRSRYYPNEGKSSNLEDILQKPARYFFYFLAKPKNIKTYTKYCCYYDDKQIAEDAINKIKDKFYKTIIK